MKCISIGIHIYISKSESFGPPPPPLHFFDCGQMGHIFATDLWVWNYTIYVFSDSFCYVFSQYM